jgi:hypothetical protein
MYHLEIKKPALGELFQIAIGPAKEEHSGITHFKESGDVYLHVATGWSVDRDGARGLGDLRGQGRLAGVKKPPRGRLANNRSGRVQM